MNKFTSWYPVKTGGPAQFKPEKTTTQTWFKNGAKMWPIGTGGQRNANHIVLISSIYFHCRIKGFEMCKCKIWYKTSRTLRPGVAVRGGFANCVHPVVSVYGIPDAFLWQACIQSADAHSCDLFIYLCPLLQGWFGGHLFLCTYPCVCVSVGCEWGSVMRNAYQASTACQLAAVYCCPNNPTGRRRVNALTPNIPVLSVLNGSNQPDSDD